MRMTTGACTGDGCDRPAERGTLCMRHYRRMKRGSTLDRRGRPKKTGGKLGDWPAVHVRVPPDVLVWYKRMGGAAWLRQHLEQVRRAQALAEQIEAESDGEPKPNAGLRRLFGLDVDQERPSS